MKEIKFTTRYDDPTLPFSDKDFKGKYEGRIGDKSDYIQMINGEKKHLALCPRCNNPVVIFGIYKRINVAPHARHAKGVDIPKVVKFNEYKYKNCPYHKKNANYVKEYVPETEEPERQKLYQITKEHFDKAIYLLQKGTGIYITLSMAEELAENYVAERAYNYIDATVYNIPWYLLYSLMGGFPLYHMLIKKNTIIYRHLRKLKFDLRNSMVEGYVYVEENEGYLLTATNYRYIVDKNDHLNEKLDFSILRPDKKVSTGLYERVDKFSIGVDSYYFSNLINYKNWKPRQKVLDIAAKYMKPDQTVEVQDNSDWMD